MTNDLNTTPYPALKVLLKFGLFGGLIGTLILFPLYYSAILFNITLLIDIIVIGWCIGVLPALVTAVFLIKKRVYQHHGAELPFKYGFFCTFVVILLEIVIMEIIDGDGQFFAIFVPALMFALVIGLIGAITSVFLSRFVLPET